MDKVKLVQAIENSGFKRQFIADKVGISSYALAQKINGDREFKLSEAKSIAELLQLSDKEAVSIFLA